MNEVEEELFEELKWVNQNT